MLNIVIDYRNGGYSAIDMDSGEEMGFHEDPIEVANNVGIQYPGSAVGFSPAACLVASLSFPVNCWRHESWMQRFGMTMPAK